ncbi:MAG: IPT/TIG domain-containing protein, partial [Chlorobi bacterium]|nr:IPT/TIG domain-containing protein [Chlorobiota bacterium]
MKFLKLKAMFIMLAIFGLALNSCEETIDPIDGDDPVITSITPSNPNVGDRVTITGANFGDSRLEDFVTFNGVLPADVDYTTWEDNTIIVEIPVGATTGNVIVDINGFESKAYPLAIGAPAPATALAANSKSATEVMLKWLASESAANFDVEYQIFVTAPGTDPVYFATAQYDELPYTVTDLTEGVVYLFQVTANYTGGENYAAPADLNWSPATRFVDNVNGETIVIYETASSFGSGLDLFDNDGEAPKSLKVASISSWNLGLYTKDGSITFGSASELNYTGALTAQNLEISNSYYDNVENLNDIFASEALDNGTFAPMTLDLSSADFADKKNLVFIVRTQEPG